MGSQRRRDRSGSPAAGTLPGHFGRVLRIGFGGVLVVLAGAVYGPDLLETRSSEAVINASTLTLVAPISGRVTGKLPQPGSLVRVGAVVAAIRNPTIDRTLLTQLATEAARLRSRVAAIGELQAALGREQTGIAAGRRADLEAAVVRLKAAAGAAAAAATAAAFDAAEGRRELGYKQELFAHGWVSRTAVEKARIAAGRAAAKADEASLAAAKAASELNAALAGVLLDRPEDAMLRERAGQIAVRQAELAEELSEAGHQLAEIERILPAERARVAERSSAVAAAPVDAVVWRTPTFAGAWINQGEVLSVLLDCRARVVHARLAGRRFEGVHRGMRAAIRILGSDQRLSGVVRDLRAIGVSDRGDRFAAPIPATGADDFIVTVLLPAAAVGSDHMDFCGVGRAVEVTFDGGFAPLGLVRRAASRLAALFAPPAAATGRPDAAGS